MFQVGEKYDQKTEIRVKQACQGKKTSMLRNGMERGVGQGLKSLVCVAS